MSPLTSPQALAAASAQRPPRPWWWYLGVAIAATVLTEPNLTLWVMQMVLGHHPPASAFRLAFGDATLVGFLFFAAFRFAPFIAFGLVAYLLDRSRPRIAHQIGFLSALLACAATMVFANWDVFRPLFEHTHFSSTSAIAFLFIPIYAGLIGVVFALLATGTHWLLHRFAP